MRCAWESGGHNPQKVLKSLSTVNRGIQHAEKLFAAGQFPIVSSCFKHVIKIMKEPNKRAASEIARFTQMSVHSLFVEQLLFPVHQGRPQVVNLFSEELLNFITFAFSFANNKRESVRKQARPPFCSPSSASTTVIFASNCWRPLETNAYLKNRSATDRKRHPSITLNRSKIESMSVMKRWKESD